MVVIAFLFVRVGRFVVVLMGMVLRVGVVRRRFPGLAIEDKDFRRGDAAAIHLFDSERRSDIQGVDGIVKHLWRQTGVEQSAEEHISADAGKAVKVGDAHEPIVSRWREELQKLRPS